MFGFIFVTAASSYHEIPTGVAAPSSASRVKLEYGRDVACSSRTRKIERSEHRPDFDATRENTCATIARALHHAQALQRSKSTALGIVRLSEAQRLHDRRKDEISCTSISSKISFSKESLPSKP